MRTRSRVLIVSVALVTLLSGCGGGSGSGKTTSGSAGSASSSSSESSSSSSSTTTDSKAPAADKLFADMKTSAAAATSLRLAGNLSQGGKAMSIDISGTRDGSNQTALVTLDGGTATVLTVGGKDYVKADKTFWTAQGLGQVSDMVGDKYLTSASMGNSMSAEFNIGKLLDEMFATEFTTIDSLNTNVEKADLDGVAAYKMTERVGGDDNTEIWVSADGQAHLLKITGMYENAPMTLTFSDWNTVPQFPAPPADQVMSV